MLSKLVLLALALVSCGTQRQESSPVQNDPSPTAKKYETDPSLHKRNSVMGVVTSGSQPVPGATLTIAKTNQVVPIDDVGSYIVVLDPEVLGTDTHELVFAAPGYQAERRTVTIPKNKRVRVDVELTREKR